MQVRFARATDNLDDVVRFYKDGVGLEVLGSFTAHDGFDGVMLGKRGESWHIELTRQSGARVGGAPTRENLIVLYFDDDKAWQAAVARMESHGYSAVAAHNPYWDRAGKTFLDVDGYGVVFQRGAWAPDTAGTSSSVPSPRVSSDDKPHSAQFLTDARDLYWNDDFLALISERLSLLSVKTAVDVGAGLGHWTRRVARMVSPSAQVTGVERDPAWVAQAAAREKEIADGRASTPGFHGADRARIAYTQGTAEKLPFADDSVDLVTCQTLLIHVADPAAVLGEMRRILRPGGLLLCAEPNNFAAGLPSDAWLPGMPVDDVLAFLKLEMTCQLGKRALGLGFNSLGERLVGFLDDAHWQDLRVWNSDRAYAARAPYPDDAKTMIAQERAWHDEGALLWPEDETKKYFVAGGGGAGEFASLWEAVRRVQQRRFRAVDDGSYAAALGGLMYLVAARKK